ncbi:Nmad5 family putative nucleotide modification protein [Rufibacter sediminis]|uniref:Nucleotide modification associated domain-containing protein n=1 Tax=Rufibacter sediminis TaxID=2762756 RepID=A0ABR6VTV7_9BACT|nr:Nmad5 family putative nucleotide modification protein [Rufibacter sediminis]MBC3540631.1 hypothetical protein [Rufibacter sediminis]
MTRLTNEIRDSIIGKAINEKFEPVLSKLKKEEHELALLCYKSIYDKKVLAAANKLPKEWTRQDGCLRFNAGGYYLTFCLIDKKVPVPYSTGCATLGSLKDEALEKARAFAEKKKDIEDQKIKARYALQAVLYSVTTINKLKTVWAEGEKFYTMYDEQSPKSKGGLPAVQIQELNEMLGLKPSKKAA